MLRGAPADIARLRDRLTREAERDDLVDVAFRTVDSPIGGLLLAATPLGLVYVAFEIEDQQAVLEMLATRIGPRVLRAPADPGGVGSPGPASRVLATATEQIDGYLAGRRREFDVALDPALATGFRGEVQRRLAGVAYGRTATYKEIAAALDRPGAVRAVGSACATNPLPLVWPCHRILRSDGALGGYRGGLEAKRRLLAMESAA
ncbi:methylated-DNA--[protein]-cysteine S-methyltransferase [Rhodococcus sp. IEGM 1408]|uniref:methylated-DNA--[protein]-cysteine S-methyltransferase n=1 Tax=Rhodococcus sp. IEGM 1408 TaxID=3082220 RepID=UPI0029551040|nr:methylated-DNA--[protein]-cysteine S-methyltransferase [Rhodococcus sp. IEGM 1408]MDV8000174.1 methylated-DNA--[protein]-cysteine S-methyltransferase [Rhodococcus sp. IEGM 1408]